MKVCFVACPVDGDPIEVKKIVEDGMQIAANTLDEEIEPLFPCLPYMIEEEYKRLDNEQLKNVKSLKKQIKEEEKKTAENAKKGIVSQTPENEFDIERAKGLVKLYETRDSRRNITLACLSVNIKNVSEADCVLFIEGYEKDGKCGKILYECAQKFGKQILVQDVKEIDLS